MYICNYVYIYIYDYIKIYKICNNKHMRDYVCISM